MRLTNFLALAALACLGAVACSESEVGGSGGDAGVDLDSSFLPDAYLPPPLDMGRSRGQFGDPCNDGRECESSYCIEAATGGRICTKRCAEDCPDGYECNAIQLGPDNLFLCVTDVPDLCKPCQHDRECDDNEDLCVRIGLSTYCAEDCSDDGRCPRGYECVDIPGEGDAGPRGRQCVPANGEGCRPCDDADGDGFGMGEDCRGFDCDDSRTDVYEGAPELCDGRDNNCNSLVDEPDLLEGRPDDVACLEEGVCRGVRVECLVGEWGCDYPESYEEDRERSCDGLDNDCDGQRDEDIDLTSDARNCGFCANACTFQHAAGLCVESSCELGGCEEGWYNVDGNDGNGCEYNCNPTRDANEVCDAIDNDCDGTTDEGFDLQRDPSHCGGCNRLCEVEHAVPACAEGRCGIERCEPGWVDLDQDVRTGCEHECAPSNDGVEICDGVDNDCDGTVDDGFDLQTSLDHCGACDRACGFPQAVAVCDGGNCRLDACQAGFFDANGDTGDGCEYACVLSRGGVEACDLIDNDCDNRVDEDFDLQTNVQHCGACGRTCLYPNGVPACQGGQCALAGCLEGFHDADGGDVNGCEYACVPSNGGVEACDATDNDCDSRTDEDFDILSDAANCGRCGRACVLENALAGCGQGECFVRECVGGFFDIDGDADNGCEYACQPTNGGLEICDGVDNDCNGTADDNAPVDADPLHCGACNRACRFDNGVPGCAGGECFLDGCEPGFVDLDGLPGNGCEYACVFRSDDDAPDAAGVDANCDGIDGDVDLAIFVRRGGNDGRDGGSPANAVATLERGMELAANHPTRRVILVANGVYRTDRTLGLAGGTSMHGGYAEDFRTRNGAHATLQVTAALGVSAAGLRAPVLLDQLDIEVTDRGGAGEAAVGVRADDSQQHLAIQRSVIRVGRGGNGTAGAAGGQGGGGNRGGDAGGSGGGGGAAPGGGNGASGQNRAAGPPGGGGAANDSDCGGAAGGGSGGGGLGCDDGDPRAGGNGGGGCQGRGGGHGIPGSGLGSFDGLTWRPSAGAGGARGGTGGGGGGGGAGGGENCRVFGQCVYCGTGRGGGGGGGGGQGGAGGNPGSGGGASLGLVLRNSVVRLEDVTVVTAGGGHGGAGGNGGPGGPGGGGGFGADTSSNTEGDGGNGGPGGAGGTGGCGGGGGGGPSVAVWGVGGAAVVQRGNVQLQPGAGGNGGASCGNAGLRGASEGARDVELR